VAKVPQGAGERRSVTYRNWLEAFADLKFSTDAEKR